MANFAVVRYLYQVRNSLPCSGKAKREIMKQVRQNVLTYVNENPDTDWDTLTQRIGAPRDIAMACLDEKETQQLLTSLRSRRKWILAACAMAVILLCMLFGDAVCQTFRNLRIREDVKAVLNATMNTPNEDLFRSDAIIVVGKDMPEEEKTAALALQEQLNENLEALVGQYFSPGSFDVFLNSTIRTRFFMDDPKTSELVDMDLISIDEKREVLDVQVKVGYRLQDFTVTFLRNDDGLFYRVEIVEKE